MQFIYFLNCYCVHSCVNNNNIMTFRSPYYFFFTQVNSIEIKLRDCVDYSLQYRKQTTH